MTSVCESSVNFKKLKNLLGRKRRNNEELDKVLAEFSLFDAPKQVFDTSKEPFTRTEIHPSVRRRKEREMIFNKNCYTSLRKKREEFRNRLIEAIVKKHDEHKRRAGSGFVDDLIMGEDAQLLRYYHYIVHGIGDEHISPHDPAVLDAILTLVPEDWKQRFPEATEQVTQEIRENYVLSVKKSIVDFVLKDSVNNEDHSAKVVPCSLMRQPG